LISKILGGGKGQSRSDDTFDPDYLLEKSLYSSSKHAYVGSLARFIKSETRSKLPFSSKSCLKNLEVSWLTPMAAKTMEKLSIQSRLSRFKAS
jgi:hypothetical protein